MRTRLVVYVAGLLVVASVAGVVGWRVLTARTAYEHALSYLPASTLRASYTAWGQVRTAADGDGLDAGSAQRRVQAFLTRAYNQDLIAGSAVAGSTYVMAKRFGVSPLDADWELLGQSRRGQVDLLHVADRVDLDAVERSLRRLGYTEPDVGLGEGGTWVGGADVVADIDATLTPVQQNVVVLRDQHLVLMSDSAAYASAASRAARGDERTLTGAGGVKDLARIADDPVAAVQWTSTFACEDLAMTKADDGDRAAAEALVERAGVVNPLAGLVMARQSDRTLMVGLHFETSAQASANLQPRVRLASGAAPGQGGSFAARFRVAAATADGQDVSLTLRPRSEQSLLSDLSTGPVLFATCSPAPSP